MNPHNIDCPAYYGWGNGRCECNARFANSDEALQELRQRLSGDIEDVDSSPIVLTVYTNCGEVTATVREDSIKYKPGGILLAEGNADDNVTFNDCYTFIGVIGYRTRPV